MNRFISCIAHSTSEGKLLIGSEKTALFDCGMLFCADKTIDAVEKALNGRALDYIFATHTHYDHIGALPAFRDRWPDLKLVTSPVGAAVLLKATPRRVIRELSQNAYLLYAPKAPFYEYSDDAFHCDMEVCDGDTVSLGDLTVRVYETPGHTRDSLSFFIDELALLTVSETCGVYICEGTVAPAYLTSCRTSIDAVKRCSQIPFSTISLPHQGCLFGEDANSFFTLAEKSLSDCRDFITELAHSGLNADEILPHFTKRYATEKVIAMQPMQAFTINAVATIACTLREMGENT